MIDFEWPWMLLLLPLPLLVRWLARPMTIESEAALRVPFLDDFAGPPPTSLKNSPSILTVYLISLVWSIFVLATMRPQWLGDFSDVPMSGRDLMLAVDLSGSMKEEDFILNGYKVDRLTALMSVASDFIDHRIGDRIGLILFGERAYLQAPLTLDRETVKIFLNESFLGLAGISTAIGDAIGLAVKRLREYESSNRVLILITDGANTSGEIEPIDIAKIAAIEGVKIYTIGIGADKMKADIVLGIKRDSSIELDEKTMTVVAEMTGGQYFRARNTRELEQIYATLDELEPVERNHDELRPKKALYYWPLSLAFMIVAGMLAFKFLGKWHD